MNMESEMKLFHDLLTHFIRIRYFTLSRDSMSVISSLGRITGVADGSKGGDNSNALGGHNNSDALGEGGVG